MRQNRYRAPQEGVVLDNSKCVDDRLLEELFSTVEIPQPSDELSAKLMALGAQADSEFEAKCAREIVKATKRAWWQLAALITSGAIALVAIVIGVFIYFNIELNIVAPTLNFFAELLSPLQSVAAKLPKITISPMWISIGVVCVVLVVAQLILSSLVDKRDARHTYDEGRKN